MKLDRPHPIRLHGPWECEPLQSAAQTEPAAPASLPPKGRVIIPCAWHVLLGAEFYGRVRFIRRFGRPTNLAVHERVVLVFEKINDTAKVSLNDSLLGLVELNATSSRFDVSGQLQQRNRLEVEVDASDRGIRCPEPAGQSAAGIVGEVRLEIG